MRVLLTSAGLETEAIKDCFVNMVEKDMASVKALFIPTAAVNVGAIQVLPKCMNDLLKCGIPEENITVYDLHAGVELQELEQYDVVYLCGGDTQYLLERINETGFNKTLSEYIQAEGMVIGVSAGSLIFADNLPGNLGLLHSRLEVHCTEAEKSENVIRLTDTIALTIRSSVTEFELIGE